MLDKIKSFLRSISCYIAISILLALMIFHYFDKKDIESKQVARTEDQMLDEELKDSSDIHLLSLKYSLPEEDVRKIVKHYMLTILTATNPTTTKVSFPKETFNCPEKISASIIVDYRSISSEK